MFLRLFGSCTLTINAGISYLVIRSKLGLEQQSKGFTGNIGYNSSYKFGKYLSATSFLNYYFPVVLLQGRMDGYYAYGFGGKYGFGGNKFILTAYANSPFNRDGIFKRGSLYEDSNARRRRVQILPFRAFGLNLTWNFGKLRDNVSKKRGVQNNDLL